MKDNLFTIATITWARSAAEEAVLRAALQVLAERDHTVFITDGGSTNSFLDWLKQVSNFRLLPPVGRGVQAQAINSMLAAYADETSYVLYTEPDKQSFFERLPLTPIEISAKTGVVLFTRTAEAFATFPAFQQTTEMAINDCCAETTGERLDYTYGPFLLHREVIPQLRYLKQDVGWGWRPYIFNIAKRMGFDFKTVEGDYSCPPGQRSDDACERIYRMRQLEQNIRGIILSTEAATAG